MNPTIPAGGTISDFTLLLWAVSEVLHFSEKKIKTANSGILIVDIKKSALESLDGFDLELYPFVSYLLQDLWEIGSTSKKLKYFIKRNNLEKHELKILDIGCGKGAISIPVVKEFNAEVLGIDAIPEFIETAKNKAKELGVENKCTFINGDASNLINDLKGFNFAMLASVGQILGDISQSLNRLEDCLISDGYVYLDDVYLPDNALSNYTRCLRESDFYKQINESNFYIVDKLIQSPDETVEEDDIIYTKIAARTEELIAKYPDKKKLFEAYLAMQRKENYALENVLQGITILLKRKNFAEV